MGRSPGGDPTRARSIVAGVSLGVIFGAIGIPLGILLGIKGYWLLVTAVAMGGVAGFIVMKFSSGFAEGSAAAIAAFVHPSGSSVPYEATFSAHDALEVAGDVAGAIEAYEATLVAEPETGTTDGGDHERFAHYVPKDKIVESAVTGEPVRALCGKVWTPGRDPSKYPVCPDCQKIYEGLPPGKDSNDD